VTANFSSVRAKVFQIDRINAMTRAKFTRLVKIRLRSPRFPLARKKPGDFFARLA
jgi:hypothetical protein